MIIVRTCTLLNTCSAQFAKPDTCHVEDFQLSPIQTQVSILSNATIKGNDGVDNERRESDISFTNVPIGLQQNYLTKNVAKDEELILSEYHKGLLIPTEDEAATNPSSDSPMQKNNSLQQSTQEKFANEV